MSVMEKRVSCSSVAYLPGTTWSYELPRNRQGVRYEVESRNDGVWTIGNRVVLGATVSLDINNLWAYHE